MYKTVPMEMSLNLKLQQCQSHNDNRGTWSNKLLVLAALYNPGVVGWSGTIDRKMSKWFLNRAKSPEFSFLRLLGRILNSLAPWTPRDLSLAFFTLEGAPFGMAFGVAILPLLSLTKGDFECGPTPAQLVLPTIQ